MSTARITSNGLERHNKIPFTLLVENGDEDLQREEHGRRSGGGGSAERDASVPKFRNIVDKFVHGHWSSSKTKHRRYNPYSDVHPGYKHTLLYSSVRDSGFEQEQQQQGQRHYGNPDEIVLDGEERLPPKERSSSVERLNAEIVRTQDLNDYMLRGEFPPSAYMGRRRSRSDTDLIATELFARRARRAAICEEMERGILMENGITLRKCRKNLVLNQILENLSLL